MGLLRETEMAMKPNRSLKSYHDPDCHARSQAETNTFAGLLKRWMRWKTRLRNGVEYAAKDLARESGINYGSIWNYINGKNGTPHDSILLRLAAAFGVETVDLFLAGPENHRITDSDLDSFNDCVALRIKRRICDTCDARGRMCPTCLLTRYIALCMEAVTGIKTVAEAETEAHGLTERLLDECNANHDRGYDMDDAAYREAVNCDLANGAGEDERYELATGDVSRGKRR